MSDFDTKTLTPPSGDNVARAYLKRHLAFKGYIVKERDESGPTKVLVNSMGLQEWERDSFDVQKGGKGKGKIKDFLMRLVSTTNWSYS